MKRVLPIILLVSIFLIGCKGKQNYDPMAYSLSSSSAKKELLLFKNILQDVHPSLNLYKSRQRTDLLFDSIDASFSGPISFRDFYNDLCFIGNEIGCSHTEMRLPAFMYDTLQKKKFFFPYPVLWIENKLLVNATGLDLPQGTQVTFINGVPVKKVLGELAVYNSVEGFHRPSQVTMAAKEFSFQYYLKNGPQKYFELNIIDTLGKPQTIYKDAITMEAWNERDSYKYYFDWSNIDYDLSINNKEHYAVMHLTTFDFDGYEKQTAFENFCANSFELLEKKKNISRLIIDLRDNNGGRLYCAFYLFSFLANRPFSEFEYVSSRINKLAYPEYLAERFDRAAKEELSTDLKDEFDKKNNGLYYFSDSLIEKWAPEKNRFKGTVFVITNTATVSAASYFALMVKNTGVGKIVGDETAGGSYSGNGFKLLEYRLPESGIKMIFPYAHMVYSIREEKNTGRGLIPNYIVPDTYESFKNNEDKQLKYILDSLKLN